MGAATGGLIGHRVMSALGVRTSVVAPYLAFGAGNIVIGLATSAWVVAATGFVLGASITVWNVVTVTVRQRVIPVDRFGRVNAVYRWLGAAASAVGVAAGGFVANQWSVRTPFVVGGVVTVLAAVLFARPVLDRIGRERVANRSAGDRAAAAAHAGAAVDHVGLAGDPRRLVGGEEHGEVGDVLRLAEPLGGQAALELTRRSCRRAPWRSRSSPAPARCRRHASGRARWRAVA